MKLTRDFASLSGVSIGMMLKSSFKASLYPQFP